MRLIERLRYWRDNSAWHHIWVANGPWWWLCRHCRALRRALDNDSEETR